MDIIMPRLDGVSATARIREWLPQAPIVAMTSNIRQEDVATYFQYGMIDRMCTLQGYRANSTKA